MSPIGNSVYEMLFGIRSVARDLQRVGCSNMRLPCRNGARQEREEAARRFFAGLLLLSGCRRVAQGLPGPLPVAAAFPQREGTAVMGRGQVRDHGGCASMAASVVDEDQLCGL